ncbi:MAG: hypothetical protein OEW24_01795 [Chloroflexota bacterium]|nr:hypothetical protein [Chloroflexota bacterium]
MEPDLPATREETALTLETAPDLHSYRDPQHQEVQQNLIAVLLPMAIIAFLVVSFVAAAWTFLAALPAA